MGRGLDIGRHAVGRVCYGLVFGSLEISHPHGAEFVFRIRLPCQPQVSGVNSGTIDARATVVHAQRRDLIGLLLAAREKEPQFVLDERSAERAVKVFNLVNPRLRGNASRN